MSELYTGLSDRFRSLWTFYQFLAGVFKHRGEGSMPFEYDFQALYRRLQELMPRMGAEDRLETRRELEQTERELGRIRSELAGVEQGFPPSLLRRFFDHLKRQDEKILFALVKFYLLSKTFEQDTLDKLDILLTRLAEAPLEDGRVLLRDHDELLLNFQRLAAFADIPSLPPSEERPLVEAVREFRNEIQAIEDFETLLTAKIYDRFRKLKQRLGRSFLHPPILVEIVSTNIEAKNRFRQLYQQEEVRILEDTNRIFEIERYIERNPDLAHAELRSQIETFRRYRVRYDSGRREDNIKREDILELRKAMHRVLDEFDPSNAVSQVHAPPHRSADDVAALDAEVAARTPPAGSGNVVFGTPLEEPLEPRSPVEGASITEMLPPDPMLNESLHKIMFALELVVWDHPPEQAANAKELHHLRLEPWEVDSYRKLAEQQVVKGTAQWDLQVFFLTGAALRVKIEEEIEEINRLNATNNSERLIELLEKSAQSLERARETDRRFQWFIEDMLYRGETEKLEQVYRSHFRFLRAYSTLWLTHQESGGITPL